MPRVAFDASVLPAAHRSAQPSLPSHARQDANRAPRFWRAAVGATKGLFNQPTRVPLDGEVANTSLVPPVEDKRKRIRRSISTPALKASASTSNLRRDLDSNPSPSLPPLFTKRSFDHGPRKLKSKASAARLAISSPSLPKPLDSLDTPHPKLAYPLSPIPSPVGSTFSLKTPSVQSTSQLVQPDRVSSGSSDNSDESRLVRRRTKSAPGIKPGKRTFFSPAMAAAQEPETQSTKSSSPIVIDIASPSIASPGSTGSLPSPPLETPRTNSDYFTHKLSPLAQVTSPRGFTSVKRKPVPRHLYMDPPEHDASAPCTPVFTPIPNISPNPSSPSSAAQNETLGTIHTPLLPSSELILKACNPSRLTSRGLNLLPIGQVGSRGSIRKQHRRSVSEHGHHRLVSPEAGLALPIPWYTTNANGSMTPLITPAEEQAPFSFAHDLPPAPRALPQSPPLTPTHVTEDVSVFSDNTSVRSSVCRSGALSPLTDDEIDAIRCFLRRHATGHRARLRRKASKPCKSHSRRTSVASCSYDIHAQILESYATDEDEFFSLDGSEDDADAESHAPMSASETHSTCTASLIDSQESDNPCDGDSKDLDVETPIFRNETGRLSDTVNRGTFGYYGAPLNTLGPRRECTTECVHLSRGIEMEPRPSLPVEWVERGTHESTPRCPTMSKEEAGVHTAEVDCIGLEEVPIMAPVISAPRSSSLYYRSSSDFAQRSDYEDSLSYLRTSTQPLVPKVIASDSESDRPLSSSTSSLSPSTSTGRSAFASGIGLAIIPPEHFAYFDKLEKYDYVPPYSPSELGAVTVENSPTALACSSPSPRTLRRCDLKREYLMDMVRTDLTDLQVETTSEEVKPGYSLNDTSSVLKPALQINANRAYRATRIPILSPTGIVDTYPPRTFVTEGMQCKATHSGSADEAMPYNVKSFMNLTPNEPTPKRSRVRLRQLFSRTNFNGVKGRKVSA